MPIDWKKDWNEETLRVERELAAATPEEQEQFHRDRARLQKMTVQTVKMNGQTLTRLKIYCATASKSQQDVLLSALEEYLDRAGA